MTRFNKYCTNICSFSKWKWLFLANGNDVTIYCHRKNALTIHKSQRQRGSHIISICLKHYQFAWNNFVKICVVISYCFTLSNYWHCPRPRRWRRQRPPRRTIYCPSIVTGKMLNSLLWYAHLNHMCVHDCQDNDNDDDNNK